MVMTAFPIKSEYCAWIIYQEFTSFWQVFFTFLIIIFNILFNARLRWIILWFFRFFFYLFLQSLFSLCLCDQLWNGKKSIVIKLYRYFWHFINHVAAFIIFHTFSVWIYVYVFPNRLSRLNGWKTICNNVYIYIFFENGFVKVDVSIQQVLWSNPKINYTRKK